MASSQPRSGPLIKASNFRSLATSRVDKNSYSQSSQPRMPAGLSVIEQFRVHRDRETTASSNVSGENDEDIENIRRRISYTKEHKLGAIRYASTTWKTHKDGTSKLISKRAAAKDLGITPAMLRQWLKDKSEIEKSTKGTRKIRTINVACQEPELEDRLMKMFVEARKIDRKITNRWFVRHAKEIYGQLHPHRVIKRPGQISEYTGFRFSRGWFQGFKKRRNICVRNPTRISQAVGIFFFFLWNFFSNLNKLLNEFCRHQKFFLTLRR